MSVLSRTVVYLIIIVFCALGHGSDSVPKDTQPSDVPRPSTQPNSEDKSGIKVGSSGFSEFKGNLPIDKPYKPPYISSVNVGSFGVQGLRSSSVLREAQLHSAASRAEMYSGTYSHYSCLVFTLSVRFGFATSFVVYQHGVISLKLCSLR